MKKLLAFLLSFVLLSSLFAGLSAQGAADYVDETYSYKAAMEFFGDTGDLTRDQEYKGFSSEDGFALDGIWGFEYWDFADNKFKPMTAYYDKNLKEEGWSHSGWSNLYTTSLESAWNTSPYNYCSVANNGKRLHPGSQAGVVITFTAPAGGTISYDLSLYVYTEKITSGSPYGGNNIALFVNDTQIWPAENGIQTIYNDNASKTDPFAVSVPSFRVNAGDKVRFRIVTSNGNNGSKGTELAKFPIVTYHKADVPIGNPKGEAPANVVTTGQRDTTDTAVSWDAAKDAVGYNVYLKGPDDADFRKVNQAPITECQYTLTGLAPKTMYEISISTLTASSESDRSDPQTFITPQLEVSTNPTTDPSETDKTENTENPDSSGSASVKPTGSASDGTDTQPQEKTFPLWIVFVIAGVILVAAVAVVFLMMKKKAATSDK